MYDPFVPGPFPASERTIHALDTARDRVFPCEIWYPSSEQSGKYPLILFSHHSGGNRRAATYLCTHLSSHGYIVAALDHSEVIAPELAGKPGETSEELSARVQAWIANRVPDLRFLLSHVLESEINLDSDRIGVVGHSFGGWTALAAPEVESRIRAVVALAPAGNSRPRPGILPVQLTFQWGRDVPTLYLAAENDTPVPLDGIHELFERTLGTKRMFILRRADHLHFVDNVEQEHERMRAMAFTGDLAWIPREMRPIAELCSGEQAHLFVRGLTLCHMDAFLKRQADAQQFLEDDVETTLAMRGVNV